MAFVLDASLALAWSFDDEAEPASDLDIGLVSRDQAIAPSVWAMEVANALVIAERRGRLTRSESTRLATALAALGVEVEPISAQRALSSVLDFARDYELTSYDASYLELAARQGIPLASIDQRLRNAAARAGVELIGAN